MIDAPFELSHPIGARSCAVFSSPHSGRDYPPPLLQRTRLTDLQIRSSEDAFVDELFSAAPRFGATMIAAKVARACVDLNRAPDDLDPALISGASRRFLNPRIAAGLGVIPRVVADGRQIIDGKITLAEAQRLLEQYWRPYHSSLGGLLSERRKEFGAAVLFDCHSMPSDAIHSLAAKGPGRPEIILGDRFGAACGRWLIEASTEAFRGAGFRVSHNAPFAGGYITQAYGRPSEGLHALQIEIDRGLYMDQTAIERSYGFDGIKTRLEGVVSVLANCGPGAAQVAAE